MTDIAQRRPPKQTEIAGFDLMDPVVHADPYPTYAWLRENAPVYKVPSAPDWLMSPLWVISRYEDVERILHDHHRFASDLGMSAPLMSMVVKDPPDHTRLRQTVNKAFTPRNIQHLAPHIEAIAEDLTSALIGRCEFVMALANPLPVTVISEMLGVPLRHRHAMNRYARYALLATFADMGTPEFRAEAEVGLRSLEAILDEAIEAQRSAPGNTIIASLVAEEARGAVSREELRNLCALLLIAGHETTANLLANGVYLMAREPALFDRLKESPDLMTGFVEELVRTRPPLQRLMRRARQPVEVAGVPIPAGALLMLLPGSANRDAAAWSDPDRFDMQRDNRRQLGFGTGIHVCPGASLTRLEARIAFTVLMRRVRAIALDPDRPPVPIVGYGAGSLGWNSLPVIVDVE